MTAGCGAPPARSSSPVRMDQAWQSTDKGPAERNNAPVTSSQAPPTQPSPTRPVIARVNGGPIPRDELVEILLGSRGPVVLRDLVVLEAAKQIARRRGIIPARRDIDREYDRVLRAMGDPLAPIAGPSDTKDAEALLDAVLRERNSSRDEFMIAVQINALLRRLVEADQTVSDQEIEAAYGRRYGRRVEIRHIQLASRSDAQEILDRLHAGESFETLARQYSANTGSAPGGGLLEPFAQTDERVPRVLRDAAFTLPPGAVSNPIRVGNWYHLLRVERFTPAGVTPIATVREELRASLLRARAEQQMRRLYQQLAEDADVNILDPTLRNAYKERFENR